MRKPAGGACCEAVLFSQCYQLSMSESWGVCEMERKAALNMAGPNHQQLNSDSWEFSQT